MRRRDRSMHLRFTEEEYGFLMKQCELSGLKPQAYIHMLIKNKPVKQRPPVEYRDLLTNFRQINVNLNQLAAKANSIGFIDAPFYWQNVKWLQRAVEDLREAMG